VSLALISVLRLAASPQFPDVTVKDVSFRNWSNCVEIANGYARLVFVPQIGRIMYFGRSSGGNLLWINSAVNQSDGWVNWGGDKLWTAPQARWNWPPDKDVDGSTWTVVKRSDGFLATSPVSQKDGIIFARRVSMVAGEPTVKITNTLQKVRGIPLDLSIWQVTQVANPDDMILQRRVTPERLDGFGRYSEKSREFESRVSQEGFVAFRRHPKVSMKFGSSGISGLVASRHRDTYFRMQTPYQEGATYPDGGLAQQIYLSNNPLAYGELELCSPIQTYRPGDQSSMTVTWSLGNKIQ